MGKTLMTVLVNDDAKKAFQAAFPRQASRIVNEFIQQMIGENFDYEQQTKDQITKQITEAHKEIISGKAKIELLNKKLSDMNKNENELVEAEADLFEKMMREKEGE